MTRDEINKILGIKEGYEMPTRLMDILKDKCIREEVFDKFLLCNNDMSVDWFTEYFQQEHSDRKALKQDFTPSCIYKIFTGYVDTFSSCADICAGTGGLTISMWNKNKNAYYYCEELSSRALPLLLFNLAIRNIEGQIIHGDSLSGKIETVYTLHHGKKYSEISTDEPKTEYKFDYVVTNPPYSLKWDRDNHIKDERFLDFGVPPASKADYGFILHGFNKLNGAGTLLAILPHGVLFRGSHEQTIRQNLIKRNNVNTIIGLPDKLFIDTQIPVCILELKKSKENKNILFVDASKQYEKASGNQNIMKEQHIQSVIDAIKKRHNIEKFCNLVELQKIEENEYNLNIPRYVDTFEAEPIPDLLETIKEIQQIDKEIQECEKKFFEMMQQLVGTNQQSDTEIKKAISEYGSYLGEKYSQQQLPLQAKKINKKSIPDGQMFFGF